MIASILLIGSSGIGNAFWVAKLHQASYLTNTCHTSMPDAVALADKIRPDVLLIEATFDNNRGFDLAREAMLKNPALRCVMVVPVNDAFRQAAIETDVSGYLPHPLNDEAELLHCLDRVAQRRRYISPLLHRLTLLPQPDDLTMMLSLTLQQKEILKGLAQGLTARQLALKMGMNEATINYHKHALVVQLKLGGANELKGFAGWVFHLL